AQHLHLVGHDFGAVAVGAGVFILPLACFEPAFDIDRAALAQVFARDLGQAVVEHHAVPFGFFAALAAAFVLPLRSGGNGDIADGGPIGAVAHLGIAPKVADEYDFVD